MAAGAALVTATVTTSGSPLAIVSVAVYAGTVLGLFGISALYHRYAWKSEVTRSWMRRLDHSMIFVFIAGTYTPVSAMALPRRPGGSCSRSCGPARSAAWR